MKKTFLCNLGFHKWTVDKTKSLITMSEERETCTRCGKRRLIVHSMFGDFVEGVDKIKED